MNYKELILQLFSIIGLFTISQDYQSILFIAITIDSIFSAISFLKFTAIHNLTQSQIVRQMSSIYNLSLLDRYLYYASLEIAYLISKILFWQTDIQYLYYFLLITICPEIINLLSSTYLKKVFNFINSEKQKFVKVVICKQISIIINNLSELCLDIKCSPVNHQEIMPLLDDYDTTINHCTEFLKNFLITSLFHYAKSKSNRFYSRLIYYLYNYQTGDIIESINYSLAKQRFIDIVVHKKWERLFKPDTLQAIFYIYSMQDGEKLDYINQFIKKFNYTLVKMFTIWTLTGFFENIYTALTLSIFFIIVQTPIRELVNRIHFYKYLIILASTIVGLHLNSYLLLSFINEFGYFIIFNKVMLTIGQYLYTKTNRNIKILFHLNKHNYFYIALLAYLTISYQLPDFYYLMSLSYIFLLFALDDNYRRFTVLTIFPIGLITDYDVLHLSLSLLTYYFMFNIMDYNNKPKKEKKELFQEKLDLNMIESYYPPLKTITNPNNKKMIKILGKKIRIDEEYEQ